MERAGFVVTSVTTLSSLNNAIVDKQWELLILCHSLSAEDCMAAFSLVALQAPGKQILALESGLSACPVAPAETMYVLNGPRSLVEKVESVFSPFLVPPNQPDPRSTTCHSTREA